MDKLKKYEKAILKILNDYSKIKYANVEGENQIIADKQNHRYQVVTLGWEDNVYINDCPIRFDIINGKIWIQQNSTEWEVGEMLNQMGVPKSDIVLGFLKPSTPGRFIIWCRIESMVLISQPILLSTIINEIRLLVRCLFLHPILQ